MLWFLLWCHIAVLFTPILLPLFLRYPQYEVYGDIDAANTAQVSARDSISSLFNIAADIQLLAESDYLVCTFSSGVRKFMSFKLVISFTLPNNSIL